MATELKISKQRVYQALFFCIVFFPLIIDFFNGIFEFNDLNIPIGKVYRGVIWLCGLLYLISRKRIYFISILCIVWLAHVLLWNSLDFRFNFSYDFSFFLKTTYFFVLYDVLKSIAHAKKANYILKYLKLYYKVVTVLIVMSLITGIGIPTYGEWGFGTRSFFEAQNDIGITILILFTLFLFNRRQLNISAFWLLMGFVSLIFLGTTTGMVVSTIIVIIYAWILFFMSNFSPVKKMIIAGLSMVAIVISSYFVITLVRTTPFFSSKYEKIVEKGVRSDVTTWVNTYYADRNTIQSVFGEGISVFSKKFASYAEGTKREQYENKGAFVERDFHDIKGAYGYIILMLMMLFYGYILLAAFRNLRMHPNMFYLSIFMIICFTYLHGYIAGHVFYSPTVGGILAAVIVLGKQINYKTLLNED